jgi:hypothetical protein
VALMRLLSKHWIGMNVRTVEQPDIATIKDARTAKVSAIYPLA